ncbi:MAG: FG-GAP-like repeat-containing protein, partial [Thiomicrorhabdus sp.]|nr:FG-GAP-like repeat-containing protein [Thiomicrorhabdus sp.]
MAELLPDISLGDSNYLTALQQNTTTADNSEALDDMGQADFLLLLTTQLQNQDPSEPVDATVFVTDLTQMSQLDATNDTNDLIQSALGSFQRLQAMQGASLIGKNVQIESDQFSHTAEESSRFDLQTDESFSDITVVISDENGIVKELNYTDFLSEQEKASWDGLASKSIEWDGFDDVGVGADDAGPGGRTDAGQAFIIFGGSSLEDSSTLSLSDLDGSNGFRLDGVSSDDDLGYSISSVGDVNGDGLDDLIIGALGDDPNGNNSGASFVVFGKTNGSVLELSSIEQGDGGFVINGISSSSSGRSVSNAGDVNGDGLADLIVAAVGDDPNGSLSGASFVVFGKTNSTKIELSNI